MNAFTLIRPKTHRAAAQQYAQRRDISLPVYKAGGMDLLDHMKEGLSSPDVLIDVRRIERMPHTASISSVGEGNDVSGLSLDANVTLARIGATSLVHEHAPALAEACENAATPQVRNVATIAGNLLQRPRCWYYRNDQFHCLKKGGDTCFARDGENAYHAIFAGGPCHIVHPSNAAVPLYVMNAEVHYVGADEAEDGSIPIRSLYNQGRDWVTREHTLPEGALITRVSLTSSPVSGFYAIKAKQSFDWPLAMAAVAIELDGRTIRAARVCAGAVAPVPWPLPAVENALEGVSVDDADALRDACAIASDDASPLRDNAYKARLLPVAVRRAISAAASRRGSVKTDSNRSN